ncbi:MAG: RNA ligase family protein [Candidatus Nanoarchaeia archaeon]|nr:RNA ligase family protein [Candidatus Nanoarchaeia archaeon]
MSEAKHCIFCGKKHEGKTCPPEAFIVMTCIKCNNEIIMPSDAAAMSMSVACGDCNNVDWKVKPATYDIMIKHNPDYGKFCVNMRAFDLKKINSATKYPSILTYHALGDRGCLKEEVLVHFSTDDEVFLSEKIDGTNARIILFPKGMYLIGSREELLYGFGDWIHNTTLDIVDTIKAVADNARRIYWDQLEQAVFVLFGEVYGGKAGTAKNYTKTGKLGFRLFDVMMTTAKEFEDLLDLPVDKIAAWRDNGGQNFACVRTIASVAADIGCLTVPSIIGTCPPQSVQETYDWLKNILPGTTNALLENDALGKPEGVVIRTEQRSKIAKIRFEDYERTLRKK